MRAKTKIFFFLALFFALAPRAAASGGTGNLQRDVEFLSDTLCAGRATGSKGASEAAFYIVRRLRSLGYTVQVQPFRVDSARVGHNILAWWEGESSTAPSSQRLLLSHYDGLGTLKGRLFPGADTNASGVAVMLALAEDFAGRKGLLFAFTDAHNAQSAGAQKLVSLLSGRRLSGIITLDTIGSTLAPVDKYWKDFLIALGGERYRPSLEKANSGPQLHLYYDYYRSRDFTTLFYRRIGEQRVFMESAAFRSVPVVVFTSGVTYNTNRPEDAAPTLDYPVLAKRKELISAWISAL